MTRSCGRRSVGQHVGRVDRVGDDHRRPPGDTSPASTARSVPAARRPPTAPRRSAAAPATARPNSVTDGGSRKLWTHTTRRTRPSQRGQDRQAQLLEPVGVDGRQPAPVAPRPHHASCTAVQRPSQRPQRGRWSTIGRRSSAEPWSADQPDEAPGRRAGQHPAHVPVERRQHVASDRVEPPTPVGTLTNRRRLRPADCDRRLTGAPYGIARVIGPSGRVMHCADGSLAPLAHSRPTSQWAATCTGDSRAMPAGPASRSGPITSKWATGCQRQQLAAWPWNTPSHR